MNNKQDLCCNNYLLIKLLPAATKLQSGIELATKSVSKPRFGYIISNSEGLTDIWGNTFKPDFEIGDLVYFMQHAPEQIDMSDTGLPPDLYFVSEGDIWTKIKVAADGNVEFLPMGNFIHIEILTDDSQAISKGGIILPEKARERPTKAKVIAVGPGQRSAGPKYTTPKVNPGDIIRFRQHSNFKVSLEDLGLPIKEQNLIGYGDVMCIQTDNFVEEIKARLGTLPI